MSGYDLESMFISTLWLHFEVFGNHDAAVEICNRADADDGDIIAIHYARLIRNPEPMQTVFGLSTNEI